MDKTIEKSTKLLKKQTPRVKIIYINPVSIRLSPLMITNKIII